MFYCARISLIAGSSRLTAETLIDGIKRSVFMRLIDGLPESHRLEFGRHFPYGSPPNVSLQLLDQKFLFLDHLSDHIANRDHTNQSALFENR